MGIQGTFCKNQDMSCPGQASNFVQDSTFKTRTVLAKPVRLGPLGLKIGSFVVVDVGLSAIWVMGAAGFGERDHICLHG